MLLPNHAPHLAAIDEVQGGRLERQADGTSNAVSHSGKSMMLEQAQPLPRGLSFDHSPTRS